MKRWVLARLLWVRKATYRVTVLAYLTQPGPVKAILENSAWLQPALRFRPPTRKDIRTRSGRMTSPRCSNRRAERRRRDTARLYALNSPCSGAA